MKTIVRGVARSNGAFKGSQSLGNIGDRVWICFIGKCLTEERPIRAVRANQLDEFNLDETKSKLHRIYGEHRLQCLFFERMYGWIAPIERGAVSEIDQAHRTSWVQLLGRSDRRRATVGEREFLTMASRTGAGFVYGH